jgi:putative transposase
MLAAVHFGRADEIIARRTTVLTTAWATYPERFVGGQPKPKPLAEAVWINPPQSSISTQEIAL